MSEVSFYGVRPKARSGPWLWLLPQDSEDGCRGLPDRARSEKPKAPNRMLIVLGQVLSPAVNELLKRALHLNAATQLFVFVPKPDSSFPDPGDASLSYGRTSYVATGPGPIRRTEPIRTIAMLRFRRWSAEMHGIGLSGLRLTQSGSSAA